MSDDDAEWRELALRLKADNSLLRQNFDELKQAQLLLQYKYDEVATELKASQDEKVAIEAEHNETMNEWRAQLEEKTREFDAARAEFRKPRDFDGLRLQFFAEFQEQSKKRAAVIDLQLQHWRKQATSVRQEFDIYRAEVGGKENEFRAQMEDLDSRHADEVMRLSLKINEMNKVLEETSSLGDRLRETQRENGEQQLRIKGLVHENDEIRAEKSEELVQHEQQVRIMRRQIADLDAMSKQLQIEKDAFKVKLERHEEEERMSRRRFDEISNENGNLQQELSRVKAQFEEAVHEFKIEQGDQELVLLKERSGWSQERADLKAKLDEAAQQLDQCRQQIDEMTSQLLVKDKQLVQKVQAAREEEWSKQRAVEAEKREIESKLAAATQSFHEAKVASETQLKTTTKELERYRAEVQDLQQKLQNAVHRNEKLCNENDEIRTSSTSMQKKLAEREEQVTRFRIEVNDTKKTIEDIRAKVVALDETNNQLQHELIEQAEKVKADRRMLEQSLHGEVQAKLAEQESRRKENDEATTALAVSADQLAALQRILKKLKSGYSKRLDEAQHQVDVTNKQIKKLELENRTLRKSLENDNHSSQLKLREMYRKQEDFLTFLQKEGLSKPAKAS